MTRDAIEKKQYDSDLDDPRLPPSEKSWLNARTALARHRIRALRKRGCKIQQHNCEFVIGCAAPFRGAARVTADEMDKVIREMVKLYIRLGHFKEEPEVPLALAG